ncbi:MAG: transketolase C-terminal domain-containing protein [Candidatus Hydrogenedentales bacterium]|jgi:transketolase
MRDAFFRTIVDLGASDERVMFLTADLGYKLFDEFRDRFPGRFLNMGVSEANMVSVSAGLALSGKRPFIYSIVPFATVRCLEQIRIDLCEMQAPVVVVGVGAGYSYGANGPSHHGVDDIGIMRALPGMTVVCPCDPQETADAMRALLAVEKPAYLRLGRAGEATFPGSSSPFKLGFPRILREGADIGIAITGAIAGEALKAADLLVDHGIHPHIISVHTLSDLGETVECIRQARLRAVLTLEEHGPSGGLYEALAGELARRRVQVDLVPVTAPPRFLNVVGGQDYLRKVAKLDAESLVKLILSIRKGGK